VDTPQRTILAEYQNSPVLTAIIDYINQWIDPFTDLDNFYNAVFDVLTAQGFGLDIWGRIVDVGRNLTIVTTISHLGFNEAGDAQTFNSAPFNTPTHTTQTYALSDDAYRTLILVKALANITDCTAPSLNRLLQILYPGQRAYVVDVGGMAIRYVFEFTLSTVDFALLTQSGALPRPAGVLATVMTYAPASTFGFQEAAGQPFGQGVFFNPSTELQNAQ
jgi:hypothetical protein